MATKSSIGSGEYVAGSFLLDASGLYGTSSSFAFWAGFSRYNDYTFEPSALLSLVEDNIDASLSMIYQVSRRLEGEKPLLNSAGRKLGTSDFFEIDIYFDDMSQETIDALAEALSKSFYHAMYPGACAGGFAGGDDMYYLIGELLDMNAGINFDDALNFCDKMLGDIESLSEGDSDSFFASDSNVFFKSGGFSRRRLEDEGTYAAVTSLMFGFCESLSDSGGSQASTGHGKIPLKPAHAWGSYLKKITPEDGGDYTETVVSFQGTKANDMGMLAFNTKNHPKAVYFDSQVHIVSEGHYAYMSSLLECFDWFMVETSTIPTFVTGHSLGGSAATLYYNGKTAWKTAADSNADSFYPRLVTFGSSSNRYNGPAVTSGGSTTIACDDSAIDVTVSGVTLCSGGDLTAAGFDLWAADGISTFCFSAPKQSVRFVHKFDPVPSVLFTGLDYAHAVENTIFLWDVYDASCDSNYDASACAISSKSLDSGEDVKKLGLKGTNPEKIKEWVCSKTKATPISYATTCEQEMTSYMTILNPFPCGFVLAKSYVTSFTASQLAEGTLDHEDTEQDLIDCMGTASASEAGCLVGYKYITGSADKDTVQFGDMEYDMQAFYKKFFVAIDDFDTCLSDWTTTVYAHMGAAVAADPASMGMTFTFSWVHSAYPMYPLCVDVSTTGEIVNVIPASMKTEIENEMDKYEEDLSCTYTQKTACKDFCKELPGYSWWSDCYTECLANDCCPVVVELLNQWYSVSTSDLTTYGSAGSCTYTDNVVYDVYDAGWEGATASPSMASVGK